MIVLGVLMTNRIQKILNFIMVLSAMLVISSPSYAISFGGGGDCNSATGFSGSITPGGINLNLPPLLSMIPGMEGLDSSVGLVLCNIVKSADQLPALISAIAYLLGIMLGVFGILKLKDHVLDPRQTPFAEPMKRFVAGGAFLALPMITEVVKNTIVGEDPAELDMSGFAGFSSSPQGLDGMLVRMVSDLWEPLQIAIGSFGYLAGLVFVMIGISRLLKSAQDGPRGPAGFGTIMTFLTAGALFSLDSLMAVFNSSLFMLDGTVWNHAILTQSTGDPMVSCHVTAVISAVVGFMILVGWISFVRGFFILREVAEGNNQASLMAALTHIFGGAIAVNLGPFINAVQGTFGLSGAVFTDSIGGGSGAGIMGAVTCGASGMLGGLGGLLGF